MRLAKRPALFLDRDGVINVDHGYVINPEQFDFVEGIFELVGEANRLGYLVVIVTNQAGIGRGYYTEADFHALTNWMRSKFVEHDAWIDAVYFCPYHAEHGIGIYRQDSSFRKPGPGMLLQAAEELNIDLANSIIVGDKVSDVEAGIAAGVGYKLLLSQTKSVAAESVSNLSQVVRYLGRVSNKTSSITNCITK